MDHTLTSFEALLLLRLRFGKMLLLSVIPTTLGRGNAYHPHLTDVETKAQES